VLAGVSAILELRNVLSRDLNEAVLQSPLHCQQMKSGGCDDDLDLGLLELEGSEDLLSEVLCELESAVLLPVATNEELSHIYIFAKFNIISIYQGEAYPFNELINLTRIRKYYDIPLIIHL
jgi:hypothetical protein